jgi:hypothetical protein
VYYASVGDEISMKDEKIEFPDIFLQRSGCNLSHQIYLWCVHTLAIEAEGDSTV